MRAIPDCYEAAAEIDTVMQACLAPGHRYYALGGIASSAIKHEDTNFDFKDKLIVPTEKAAELIYRDNGTLRDVDILVNTVLSEVDAEEIKANVGQVTDLVVSVFGLDERVEQPGKADKLKSSVLDWTSKRTIDENGIIRYELFPLEQPVKIESFDPWTLVLPKGGKLSVFSPPAHMLAYRMRSISGVRYKDQPKLSEMTDVIMDVASFRAQITEPDGLYREWLDFALGIYKVQDGAIALNDPMLARGTTDRDIELFGFKGRALGAFESNETIIKLAQTPLGEKILSPFTRSK